MTVESGSVKKSLAEQIKELAKARGLTVSETLKKIVEGSRLITRFREGHQSPVQPDSAEGGTGLH